MNNTEPSPRVTRGQIITRGLTHRCPNCGGHTLFKEGRLFEVNPCCTGCGLPIERDEGSFLGAISLNYGITVVCFLVPIMIAWMAGWLSGRTAAVMAAVGAIAFPILFYRSSRSWWLMNYYLVVPHHLPANQRELADDEDANT